jgi:hypothetical protein
MSAPFTPEQEARIREIIREEMDAEEAWRVGYDDPARTERHRRIIAEDRAAAIASGRRADG